MHATDLPPVGPEVALTIIVKALNEEGGIAACLRSALAELDGLDGEVVLADSLSTDRTVEIAAEFQVRIVQFESSADRSCGAALQLGYQFARGHLIYVLDGDMTMEPGFLRAAIAYLAAHPDVAGVGGRLLDRHVHTMADRLRVVQYEGLREECDVRVLGGGGLYRRSAIEAVGYLSNRWLPAFEEAELGVRLAAAGWRLVRLAQPAVSHSGHRESSSQMLMRLWRNGRIEASGTFLRAALGHSWLGRSVKLCWFVFAAPALYCAALLAAAFGAGAGAAFFPTFAALAVALWALVFGVLAWRKKSLAEAALALASWHLYALGAARGFLRPAGDPRLAIPAREQPPGAAPNDRVVESI
ncbi:glycosyltransferase involved in cell wall biosynthesis [Janthinobacterium sp. CG_23.3]|uniref:glycosyltransferase n=1 Tax=Janthinobacterium sp. CG_23.3 TaxID=3349634 RepID=UPI0038D45CD6